MYLFVRIRLCIQTGCIRDITLPSFCPVGNMRVCVCIVYARETLRVIPNGRIVSAPRGYCPTRDSSSADDRTGSDWALLKATTRPPICVRCISIRRLRSVVVPPLKWTSAIVTEFLS